MNAPDNVKSKDHTRQASVAAKAYYEWHKAVWRSGSKRLCQAGPTVAALVTFGTWGHYCRPSFPTLADLGGVSVSTVARRVRLFRSAGLLYATPRPGRSTVYCIAVAAGEHPGGAVGGPCPTCPPPRGSVTHDRGGAAPVTDDQESFQDDAGSGLAPAAPAGLAEDERLVRLLWQNRPTVRDQELILFQQRVSGLLHQQPYAQLERNTIHLATKAKVITARSIDAFLSQQAREAARRDVPNPSTAPVTSAGRLRIIRDTIIDWADEQPDQERAQLWWRRAMDMTFDDAEEVRSTWLIEEAAAGATDMHAPFQPPAG